MSDDVDIVDRLRISWTSMTDMGNAEREEAADEIERLREEIRVQNLRHVVSIERLAATINALAALVPDDPEESVENNGCFRRGDGETCQREAC